MAETFDSDKKKMAETFVTDQVKELVFNICMERIWDKNWSIGFVEIVNIDIPSILFHLDTSSKRNISDERKPQLSKLIINGTNLKLRHNYDHNCTILNSYEETKCRSMVKNAVKGRSNNKGKFINMYFRDEEGDEGEEEVSS